MAQIIPLSVVIITKNEAARIEECLRSVFGWAQEIILVDDESSDNTREIAKVYTDKIFVRKMDNEGRQRNWAQAQATGEWILVIDADERVSPQLQKEIATILEKNPRHNGFAIPRKNFVGNRWLKYGGQYPAAQLRLFRKSKFKWEEADVHPRVFLEGEFGVLEQAVLHYTYKDVADWIRKVNNQTNLEARKFITLYQRDPKKALQRMNLTITFWRSFDRFFRAFLLKAGWRDGFFGFLNAFLIAVYQIFAYAKFLEQKKKL